MNWILEHLNLIFIIGGAIAWWFNQRNKPDEEEGAPPRRPDQGEFDPELEERTRRIREEIQRKIEERTRGGAAPSVPQPAPYQPTEAYDEPPPVIREFVPPSPRAPEPAPRAASRFDAQRQAEILEQQAALAEQLRMAEEMKRAAQKRAAFEATVQQGTATAQARTRNRGALLEDIKDPEALRRAFVLREVLGPPLALK